MKTMALLCIVAFGCSQEQQHERDQRRTQDRQRDSATSATQSPRDAFNAAQKAALKRDTEKVLAWHSQETLESSIAPFSLASACLMRFVADMASARGDDRFVPVKKHVDSVLDKHGVDVSDVRKEDVAGEPNLAVLHKLFRPVENKTKFVAELLDALESGRPGTPSGFEEYLVGSLDNVIIRGNSAEGVVVSETNGLKSRLPISFKKTDEGWRIHMPIN